MTRTLRRGFAWLGIVGIVLAQLAATAHACVPRAPAGGDVLQIAIAAGAGTAIGHCHEGVGTRLPAAPDLCAVHCTDAAAPVAIPERPPVVPAPAASVLLAALAASARDRPAPQPPAPGGAPPLILRFGRLLI
jgi:hypothetical protein